jgi:adenine deaminase
MHSGELTVTSERIICVAMRVGDANDYFVIPTKNAIQEAHRAEVGDKGANFGFIDEHVHLDMSDLD